MIEILTTILVIITAFYAWVTFKMLKANEHIVLEMENQRTDLIRPYINMGVVLYPESSMFYLNIKNSGKTAAQNLILAINKDFYQAGHKEENANIKNFNLFTKTIDSFTPNSSITLRLAQSFVVFGKNGSEEITPKKFTIKAIYDFGSKRYFEDTKIDLTYYLNTMQPYDPLVKEIKNLTETIEKKHL